MSRRHKRNLLLALKICAIVGAAVFMFAGVKETFIKAQGATEETETVTVVEASEIETVTLEPATEEVIEVEITTEAQTEKCESMIQSRDWSWEESYLLAKIAMAEAEGEDVEGKALVIAVVLNRVWSNSFPGTIEEVIFQYNEATDVYQFSPLRPGGRWWTTEPNEECWDAVSMVQEGWDESQGALYFESMSKSKWHQNHLQYLFQHGNHYFYTDKEPEE